uniref:Putative secreted protein n=1 Tax=Rhipicephalus microplus TaxID=6941 RepID=A0A6M2D935_RHIMP
MVIQGLMLFVLLDRLDSGQFFWMPGPPTPAGQGAEASAADEEVRQERKLVEAEVAKGKSAEYAMAARGIRCTSGHAHHRGGAHHKTGTCLSWYVVQAFTVALSSHSIREHSIRKKAHYAQRTQQSTETRWQRRRR